MANNFAGDEAVLQLQDLLLGTANVEDFLGRLAEFSAATLSRTAGAPDRVRRDAAAPEADDDGCGQQPRAVTLDRIEQSHR